MPHNIIVSWFYALNIEYLSSINNQRGAADGVRVQSTTTIHRKHDIVPV